MLGRCKATHPAAKWYFAKGVTVCDQWQDFAEFREWAMSHGYQQDLSIDRVDSNAGYHPANCEWVTLSENGRRMQAAKRKAQGAIHAVG